MTRPKTGLAITAYVKTGKSIGQRTSRELRTPADVDDKIDASTMIEVDAAGMTGLREALALLAAVEGEDSFTEHVESPEQLREDQMSTATATDPGHAFTVTFNGGLRDEALDDRESFLTSLRSRMEIVGDVRHDVIPPLLTALARVPETVVDDEIELHDEAKETTRVLSFGHLKLEGGDFTVREVQMDAGREGTTRVDLALSNGASAQLTYDTTEFQLVMSRHAPGTHEGVTMDMVREALMDEALKPRDWQVHQATFSVPDTVFYPSSFPQSFPQTIEDVIDLATPARHTEWVDFGHADPVADMQKAAELISQTKSPRSKAKSKKSGLSVNIDSVSASPISALDMQKMAADIMRSKTKSRKAK